MRGTKFIEWTVYEFSSFSSSSKVILFWGWGRQKKAEEPEEVGMPQVYPSSQINAPPSPGSSLCPVKEYSALPPFVGGIIDDVHHGNHC